MIIDNKTIFEGGKYRLNEDYVLNEMGTDLRIIAYDEFDANPSTLPTRLLREVSNVLYDYMETHCKDFDYACELIETEEKYYNAFVRALEGQLNSFMIKGDSALNGGESICHRAYEKIVGLLYKRRKPSFSVRGEY